MKLVLIKEGHAQVEFELGIGSNLIGRWDPDTKSFPEVDLEEYDSDSLVSRRHAIVLVKDDGVSFEDLGSKNGSFQSNGTQINPGDKIALEDGSEIYVGNLKLRFLSI